LLRHVLVSYDHVGLLDFSIVHVGFDV
jgi:hypothetical protein